MIRFSVPLVAALLTSGGAWAKDNVAHADAAFMKKAAEGGLAEVEAAKLAQSKGVSPQVKTFGMQMTEDHSQAGDELKQLASGKGVELPTEPSLGHKAKLKLLNTADGVTFDKRYADSWGVEAHEDMLKLFQKAAKDAKDPDVKAFATKTLPTVQHHLEMGKGLKTAVAAEKK
jgi:putative membrane protein